MVQMMKNLREVNYDVPELKKCLCCVPLRPALTVWGIIQVVWTSTIFVLTITNFCDMHFKFAENYIMFAINLVVTMMELAMAVFIIISAYKANWQHMNKCYNYTLIKIMGYVIVLLISLFFAACCYSDTWFERNVDPIRLYFLRYNPFAGVLEIVILTYMALVMRSYIHELGGTPHCICHRRKHLDMNVFIIPQQFSQQEKSKGYDNQPLFPGGY